MEAHGALLTFEDFFATITETVEVTRDDGTTATRVLRDGAFSFTQLSGEADGIGMTLRRRDNAPMDIIDNNLQPSKAQPGETLSNGKWGDRSLDPFISFYLLDYVGSPSLIVEYSVPVHFVSFLIGDWNGDNDIVELKAYTSTDASGTPVAVTKTVMPAVPNASGPLFTEMRVSAASAADIRSVELTAGLGAFQDNLSVFIDRILALTTPPPVDPIETQNLLIGNDTDNEHFDGSDFEGAQIPLPSTLFLSLGLAMLAHRRSSRV